ncbi:unnamed protein product [Linum tenue]|uniref:Uncharacterized protein n=1 Tax=Linum tenue TaxID=586396 RepID=A0AAV0RUD5_9ROSI|nr:unnamed protein product [Linum tenue]
MGGGNCNLAVTRTANSIQKSHTEPLERRGMHGSSRPSLSLLGNSAVTPILFHHKAPF